MATIHHPTSAPVALPGAIERYFQIALYLLVLTGFATLASTGGLDLPTMVLAGGAILFRGYCVATQRRVLIPERWTTILTLVYVVFYLADYLVISRTFVSPAVHLVLFVLVVRLFSARRDRDHYFLAVIAFLMVLAAAVLTVDSTFLLAFCGFMLTAVATFILMEMRRSSASAAFRSATEDTSLSRQMGVSLAKVTPALVLLIALGALVIFFVLPRVSSGYLSAYTPSSEIATGFSDRVQLGRIGEIQQSGALVMHIQIDGDSHGAFDLKWRGVALSLFDGTTWSNPYEHRLIPRSPGGQFVLSSAGGQHVGEHLVHYRVLMEPIANNVFFLAPEALSLGGNYRLVSRDDAGAVFDTDLEHPVSTYDAQSDIAQPGPAVLRGAALEYPPAVLLNYLQLPRLDPRVAPLAEQITAGGSNNYDKAVALERYLRTHFGYTLQLGRSAQRDPLAYFLFERKQGHCEYFASAMAVMLRTLRIPSRVVNGFRTGEFNDVTSQYLVRASNAHSWVEAYFPGIWLDQFRSHASRAVPGQDGLEPLGALCRCDGLVLAGVGGQLRREPSVHLGTACGAGWHAMDSQATAVGTATVRYLAGGCAPNGTGSVGCSVALERDGVGRGRVAGAGRVFGAAVAGVSPASGGSAAGEVTAGCGDDLVRTRAADAGEARLGEVAGADSGGICGGAGGGQGA